MPDWDNMLADDDRPPKHGWAAGGYTCRCSICEGTFMGDKRASMCAPCAYAYVDPYEELKNRRGRFVITRQFIKQNPEAVMQIMGEMIIFRAELLYMYDGIQYDAMSHKFDEVDEGIITPEYEVIFDPDSMSDIQFKQKQY